MMMKQPEALRIADDLHHSITHYGGEDAFTFAAYEAQESLRALHAEKEMLIAGYDAARLEIESLHERVQQLGQAARDVNSRRVVELEAQLEAIGAGGVEPLRKRECLRQISEPAQAGWCKDCNPDNCGGCATPAAPAKAEREAFEGWVAASGRAHMLKRDDRNDWYADLTVTAWWTAWQASAARGVAAGRAQLEGKP